MSLKEKYIEFMHELCELIIKNQGEESSAEETLLAKIDSIYDQLSIGEQDEVDEMEPYCDHPDGWIADDWVKGVSRNEEED